MKQVFYFTLFVLSCTSTFGQWSVNGVTTHLFLTSDMHFISGSTGFIVGTDAMPNGNMIISKTTNGGASWTKVFSMAPQVTPNVFTFNDINFVTSNVAYASGGYANDVKGIICKTTDGGSTWDTLPHNLKATRVLHTYFFNVNEGFCTAGGLFKTMNGGITWDTVNTPSHFGSLKEIHFINQDTGYVLGINASVLIQSVDGGVTWNTITLPTSENTRDMHFIDNKIGFIGCDNGVILKSTDGGSSWSGVTNNDTLLGDILSLEFADAQTGFAGTIDGYILKSTDAGNTWNFNFDIESSPFLPFANVTCIDFINSNVGYAGTSFNYMVKTTNGGGSGPGPSSVNDEFNNSKISFYPNPVSGSVYFKSERADLKNASVLLKSLDGKVLNELFIKSSVDQMDVSNLSPGLYLLEIRNGSEISVHKLVKQ